MSDEQFEQFAFDILTREMGLYGLARSCAFTALVPEITPATGING